MNILSSLYSGFCSKHGSEYIDIHFEICVYGLQDLFIQIIYNSGNQRTARTLFSLSFNEIRFLLSTYDRISWRFAPAVLCTGNTITSEIEITLLCRMACPNNEAADLQCYIQCYIQSCVQHNVRQWAARKIKWERFETAMLRTNTKKNKIGVNENV
jgi:hypothetical protein